MSTTSDRCAISPVLLRLIRRISGACSGSCRLSTAVLISGRPVPTVRTFLVTSLRSIASASFIDHRGGYGGAQARPSAYRRRAMTDGDPRRLYQTEIRPYAASGKGEGGSDGDGITCGSFYGHHGRRSDCGSAVPDGDGVNSAHPMQDGR